MSRERLPRLPFVLLGAMTASCLGGPFAIGSVLRGGPSPNWPPDRAVEWVTVLGVSGTVLVLMLACVSLGFVNRKAMAGSRPPVAPPGPEERP